MSGRLGEWSIEDLLQIARITHKTTSIEVISDLTSGVISLREGAIVDAWLDGVEVNGGSRFSRVVEAIEVLSRIEDGSFQFGTRDRPVADEQPIEVSAVTAAMEKDALREKRLADLGLSEAEGLGIERHLDDVLMVKPAVWQLLADLIDTFSLASLERSMGRRKAVATLLTLEALGVLLRDQPSPEFRGVEPVDDQQPPHESVANEDESVRAHVGAPGNDAILEAPTGPDADEQSEGAGDPGVEAPSTVHTEGEPIVEIFEPMAVASPQRSMHEVVTPSETTLVSDVLGDMRNRFRNRHEEAYVGDGHDPEPDEDVGDEEVD